MIPSCIHTQKRKNVLQIDNDASRNSCSPLTSVCAQPGVFPPTGSLLHPVWKGVSTGIPVRFNKIRNGVGCNHPCQKLLTRGKINVNKALCKFQSKYHQGAEP